VAAYEPPRTADGKPDFSGVWQVLNTANDSLEAHPGRAAQVMREGPVVPVPVKELVSLGAVGAIPPGIGVVEGGEIPYKDEALVKREENRANWITADPEVRCYLPGIPRATYMPFPFQIVHNRDTLFFSYAYAGAVRNVALQDPGPAPIDSWMGQSWARWTRTSEHTIDYSATMEDPEVFTRPWTISMPLYRRVGADETMLQFNCVEYVEEMMYGHLRKEPVD
jgi:hypothetical protein